jgi:hypothetical protein
LGGGLFDLLLPGGLGVGDGGVLLRNFGDDERDLLFDDDDELDDDDSVDELLERLRL